MADRETRLLLKAVRYRLAATVRATTTCIAHAVVNSMNNFGKISTEAMQA